MWVKHVIWCPSEKTKSKWLGGYQLVRILLLICHEHRIGSLEVKTKTRSWKEISYWPVLIARK